MGQYELEDRTLRFSIQLISTLKLITRDMYNMNLISQVIRSGTSIGANYVEANGAESKKDFRHKVRIAYKEARETRYWLRIFSAIDLKAKTHLEPLLKESDEYVRIFAKIITTVSKNLK